MGLILRMIRAALAEIGKDRAMKPIEYDRSVINLIADALPVPCACLGCRGSVIALAARGDWACTTASCPFFHGAKRVHLVMELISKGCPPEDAVHRAEFAPRQPEKMELMHPHRRPGAN